MRVLFDSTGKLALKRVYISVGHPALPTPMIHRLEMDVPDTREAAKKLRKEVAETSTSYGFPEKLKVSPSDLYWAIFDKIGAERPVIASDNYFWKFGVREQFGDTPADVPGFVAKAVPA